MKEVLPSYSTDLTEIHHLSLKRAFRRSNKCQEYAIKFILRDQTTSAAFQNIIDGFDTAAAIADNSDDSDSENQLQEVEEEMEDDEIHSRLCGTRI